MDNKKTNFKEAVEKELNKNNEVQISPEEERCNISKDYEFVLFIKNGLTYLYKKGENVGGYCTHFECIYDFKTDKTKYKIDY